MSKLSLAFQRFATLCAIAWCWTSCKQLLQTRTQGYVLGPGNDILQVKGDALPEAAKGNLNKTALIVTDLNDGKRKLCSGALISTPESGAKVHMLTNFHCFAATDSSGNTTEKLLEEACTYTKIYFGLTVEAGTTKISQCKPGSLKGDFGGDIALFELQSVPPEVLPFDLWSDDDIPANREVYIVHYPDIKEHAVSSPDEKGRRIPSASVTRTDCSTKGDFPPEEWLLDHTLPFSTKHTCDIVHGSSGSPLIDSETQTVLGVNWGGIEIKYKDNKQKINAATKSSYVKAFLRGEAAIYQQQAQDRYTRSEQDQKDREKRAASAKRDPRHWLSSDLTKGEPSCGVVLAAAPTTTSPTEQSQTQIITRVKQAVLLNVVQKQFLVSIAINKKGKSTSKEFENFTWANSQSEMLGLPTLNPLPEKAAAQYSKKSRSKATPFTKWLKKNTEWQSLKNMDWNNKPVTCEKDSAPLETIQNDLQSWVKESSKWSDQQIYCWTTNHLKVKSDAIPVSAMLMQHQAHHTPLSETETFQWLATYAFLAAENYPESLRVLFDLQSKDTSLQFMYGTVQKIYSMNQRAAGDVALKQDM